MSWRIVHIPDTEAVETDLTDTELIGIDVVLREFMGEPQTEKNVYWRAWVKLEDSVRLAHHAQD